VLAAVATGAGSETSGSCSRFVSVNLSLEGVISRAGSEGVIAEVGGVLTVSGPASSIGTGGGSPGMSSATKSCCWSWKASAAGSSPRSEGWGAFFGIGAGAGLLKILAQLRVPSGFRLGLGGSSAGVEVASATVTFSHDASRGVVPLSAGWSQPPITSLVIGASSQPPVSVLVSAVVFSGRALRGPLAVDPALPPRDAPRLRSEPRPRPPRVPS